MKRCFFGPPHPVFLYFFFFFFFFPFFFFFFFMFRFLPCFLKFSQPGFLKGSDRGKPPMFPLLGFPLFDFLLPPLLRPLHFPFFFPAGVPYRDCQGDSRPC